MQIKKIDRKTLAEHSNSVFLTEKYLGIYDQGLEPYGIFTTDGQLRGGFVIYRQKRGPLTYYRNPPFMSTINLFYENKAANKSKRLSEEKKLMKVLADFFNKLSYGVLSVYLPERYQDMQPFFWAGYKAVPNYTYHIDLMQSMDSIRKNYSTERRNDIKKAAKDGVSVALAEDLNTVKDMVQHTFNRKEKDLDQALVQRILFDFADDSNSFAFVAQKDGKPIAAAFCVYEADKVYYLLGGYDSGNKHTGAGAMAVDAAIEHSKKLGIKTFDFEGSMLPEVERYFRGFGGDLIPYFSINKAKLPIEIALKFINRAQF